MLGQFLFFLLFPLAMIGLRKLFPYRAKDSSLPTNPQAFKKYKKWDKISGWLLLLFISIGMLIICGPLFIYYNYTQLQDKLAQFIVLPGRFYWFIIGWIPLFGLSPFVIYLLGGKFYLGSDFSGYIDYSNQRNKYNVFSAIFPLCGGFALLGIALFCFIWNYNIYAYRDRIVVHWFLSTKAQVYRYDQIKSISFVPETAKQGASYTVTFKDNMDWNNILGLADADMVRHVNFISERSGVKIDTVLISNN